MESESLSQKKTPLFLDAKLLKKTQLNESTYEISFTAPAGFEAKPGQYIWLALGTLQHPDEKGDRRIFSISSGVQDKGVISIITKKGESGYEKSLIDLADGAMVKIRGPLGNSFDIDESLGPEVCFIGEGARISPFVSILRSWSHLSYKPNVTFVNVQLTKREGFLYEEIEGFNQNANTRVITVFNQFDVHVLSKVENAKSLIYFISGSQDQVNDIFSKLKKFGVPEENMRFQEFYPFVGRSLVYDVFTDYQTIAENPIRFKEKFASIMLDIYAVFAFSISLALAIFFAILHKDIQDIRLLGTSSFCFFIIIILSSILKKKDLLLKAATAITFSFLLFGLYRGMFSGSLVYWLYFFPPLAFLFLSRRMGLVWNITYLALITITYGLSLFEITKYAYQPIIMMISVGTVTLTIFICYFMSEMYEGFEYGLAEIAKSELKIKMAVESSSNHTIITDPNGTIIFANKAALAATGYTIAEILGNTPRLWGSFMPPEFYGKSWNQPEGKKQSFDGEVMNIRKDGKTYTALSHLAPIFDRDENILGYISTEEDVSLIKQQQKLLESQNVDLQVKELIMEREKARDEAILLSLGDGLIVTDKNGKVWLINSTFQKLLGMTEQEVQAKPVVEVLKILDEFGREIPPENRPITKALTQGQATIENRSFQYVKKNGTVFPVAITVAPILMKDSLVGVVEIFRDITHEKEVEKMKSDFVSIASHQLRTPITGIQWTIERFVKKVKVSKQGKEYLNDMHHSLLVLGELVESLLNVSRLEGGTVGVQPKEMELISTIKEYVKEVAVMGQEKKIKISFESSLKKQKAILDPNLFRHILQSLVSNAIEYTSAGGYVKINLEPEKDKNKVILTVQDSGIGIPRENYSQIFNKFYRADNAKEVKPGGSGLGLFITKIATELLEGKIMFRSVVGKGTTFFVELPLEVKEKLGTKTLL